MTLIAMADSVYPLFYTFLAIACLVFLIAWLKVHSFIALILASLFVGFCSEMKLPDVARAFQEGMGATLGFVAPVIGLGTILGKMLAESGGATVIARAVIRLLGGARLHWTLMLVGLIVGIPVFFAVGLVLLMPIVFTLVKETGKPLLMLGLPLVAGLSVAHGLVPPHPGPMIAIEKLGADSGKTLFYSLLVGLPAAIVAGPLYAQFIAKRIIVAPEGLMAKLTAAPMPASLPSPALALGTILAPLGLMMCATIADLTLPAGNPLRTGADFLGSPLVSLLVAVLLSFYTFGAARGFNRHQILEFTETCVAPAATIFLVVGAGGGFSKVLDYAGVDDSIAHLIRGASVSPLFLGWMVAALIRIAVGSATVSITMSAAIVGPAALLIPGTNRELLVVALGAGSLILSHLNDGGFWFVKEYLGMTVGETLRTWTVLETLISITSLGIILVLDGAIRLLVI